MIGRLDLYKVFRIVVRNKSFSKAARSLYMTQPAVSQAMMQLEKDLQTRLFNRIPTGVTLTDEGRLLYEYVNSAIHLIQTGEEKITKFQNLVVGELKIGVGDTIAKYFLLPYLESFRNQYPKIHFKIENGTTTELCELLKAGEVDIAICNLPIEDKALNVKPCLEVQDTFVYGEKFIKVFKQPVSLKQLVEFPLIFLEPKSNSRRYVENYFISKGISLNPEFELGSHELLLQFAKINLGVACVTKQFSKHYLNRDELYEVKLKEPIPKRQIGICSLKRVPLSPAATRFVEILEKDFNKM